MEMRQQNSAGCLTGLVASFSRIFLIFAWFARPLAFDRVFSGSWLLPCLGIMILPFTTLMYVFLVTNGVGVGSISGLDWLWMALAVLVDLATIGTAGAANRNQIPQGYPGALPPTAPKP
jgi:cytochrome c oxidase assembly factor CtaG